MHFKQSMNISLGMITPQVKSHLIDLTGHTYKYLDTLVNISISIQLLWKIKLYTNEKYDNTISIFFRPSFCFDYSDIFESLLNAVYYLDKAF